MNVDFTARQARSVPASPAGPSSTSTGLAWRVGIQALQTDDEGVWSSAARRICHIKLNMCSYNIKPKSDEPVALRDRPDQWIPHARPDDELSAVAHSLMHNG